MAPALPTPPLDGSLSPLAGFLEFQVQHNPHAPFAIFPALHSPSEPQSVTYLEYSNAVHRVAQWFNPGRQNKERRAVALLLQTDTLLYSALVLGLIISGAMPFPMSPRNSPEAVCNLLEKSSCHDIISQPSLSHLISEVHSSMSHNGHLLTVHDLPPLLDVFPLLSTGGHESVAVPRFPPPEVELPLDVPVMYLHSSGSTGLPKAIPFKPNQLLRYAQSNLSLMLTAEQGRVGAMPLPGFHAMGIAFCISIPLGTSLPVAMYTPQYPAPPVVPSPQSVIEACKITGANTTVVVPSFVEAWSQSPEIVQYLKTFKAVIFGGGPLSNQVGEKLTSEGICLVSAYGGTEFGSPAEPVKVIDGKPILVPDENWAYLRWSSNVSTEMIPQGDGTWELHIFETESAPLNVYNLPGKGWATSDLFEPHPIIEGLWRLVGRKDDVIALSLGEKIVPIAQEHALLAHPAVKGAVMFGQARSQAGVLIEPNADHAIDPDDEVALVKFRNMIWPTIEEGNAHAPGFARLFKEMILVTDPRKPLPRSAKGNVIRRQATLLYEKEVDRLYSAVAESTNSRVPSPKTWRAEDIESWVAELAAGINNGQQVVPSLNLFEQGFDSLGATFLRNRIIAALRSSEDPSVSRVASEISQNFVFENPTVQDLAIAVESLTDPSSGRQDRIGRSAAADLKAVEALIEKYSANLPTRDRSTSSATPDQAVVVLTGSTGNIGSHILASLLADPRVQKVYSLNRASSSASPRERVEAAFSSRGLPSELLGQKRLVCLVGDLSSSNFGLAQSVFQEIMRSATHVIHNGWTVNFNHSLKSFEGLFTGVRNLIDFCASSDRAVKIFFTSSIGVAGGWNAEDGLVPEDIIPYSRAPITTGYSASKYVVERVLAKAAKCGVQSLCIRMGQACGPEETGAWGTTEWMPIMVKSSVALGGLPKFNGPVAWVPLDAIGQMYIDLVFSREQLPQLVNVVHPRPATWSGILQGLSDELALPIISSTEWLARLDDASTSATAQDLKNIPALKLLGFFRGLPNEQSNHGGPEFETTKLQQCSPTIRGMPSLGEKHARQWVRYWVSSGYITRRTV